MMLDTKLTMKSQTRSVTSNNEVNGYVALMVFEFPYCDGDDIWICGLCVFLQNGAVP